MTTVTQLSSLPPLRLGCTCSGRLFAHVPRTAVVVARVSVSLARQKTASIWPQGPGAPDGAAVSCRRLGTSAAIIAALVSGFGALVVAC
jgi:hypothetical protein